MNKKSHSTPVLLVGILLLMAVPTCYFIANRDNPNDPKNLNEYMGLPVADTGQDLCYNADGVTIDCDEDPAGFPRQDGFYVDKPNARSFTGPTQHPTYPNDYTTKDNVTGLVWKSCSERLSGLNCAGSPESYTWAAASGVCTALNSENGGAGYAGRKSWRLPAIAELSTLPNYGTSSPAIDEAHFPATVADSYWSSTILISDATYMWAVHFDSGRFSSGDKTSNYYVRCVTDGP